MPELTGSETVLLKTFELDEITFKEDDPGYVKAQLATMDTVDRHNDILLPGSAKEQYVTMSSYGHSSWGGLFSDESNPTSWPMGKGKIYEDDSKLFFEGKMFMDMDAPQQLYKLLKNMGRKQQWSFSLENIKADYEERNKQRVRVIKKFDVHEVSPVFKGASIGSKTVAVKSNDEITQLKAENEQMKQEIEELKRFRNTVETYMAFMPVPFSTTVTPGR